MAFIPAAIASAVTYVTSAVASTAVAVGVPTALAKSFAVFAVNAAVQAGTALAVNAVTSIFAPQVGQGGSPIAFKADPSAPIFGVMGRFGVGGRQLHANVWGKDNLYISFAVALSMGPIQSVEQFTANGNVVTFPGSQGLAAPVEPYKDKMWQTYRLGLPTDGALLPPSGVSNGSPAMSEWTSSHTLPGFAQAFWTMQNNSKRASYESGVPAPIWTLLGMKVWDPREDSTYPGGSGSQRRDQWNTWAYSANPYLHALAWVRGHAKLNTDGTVDRTKRLAGVGAPDEAIDIAAFVEGANVCDANDWTIAGEWTTADDKWQVLAAMLQAGGGVPLNRGAQISCMVEAPRTSLLTLTGADIVGSVSLNVMASRRDRPNTIVPRVRLEAQKFEEVALGPVTSSTYLAEDGGEPRTREVPYRYVGDAAQGAQLAAYGLANARETLKASIPCKPHLLNLRAGDAFTVTEPELGLNGQKFVVVKRAFDPSSCVVTLDVRSETDGKHAFALGQEADAPATPSLTAVDPVPEAPDIEDWTVVVRPPDTGGSQQPGVVVTGTVVNERAASVLIEHGPSEEGPWTQVYDGPPTTEEVVVNGLQPGEEYWIAISVRSIQGVPSARTVYGPYTAPNLVADDAVTWGGRSVEDLAALETASRASLEEILRLANDRAAGSLSESLSRIREIRDALDRLSRLADIDPIEGTVIIRRDTIIEGEGGATLATTLTALRAADSTAAAQISLEMSARLAGDAAEAAARLAAVAAIEDSIAAVDLALRAYVDGEISEATASLVTTAALNSAIAAADLTLRAYTDGVVATATAGLAAISYVDAEIAASALTLTSYVDAEIASATAGLATTASVNSAIAAADLALRAYTDGEIAEATVGLVTTAALNSAISTATLDLQSYADSAVASGTAGLATVSQLDTAVAGALVTAQSYVDAYEATATATFATIATVNGISGSVTTLQSSVVTIEGQIELTYGFALNAGGRVTGMRAVATNDLTTIDFEADAFRIWSGTANVPAFAVVDGAVYVAGNRVNTTSLVANAVTNGASARTTGATTVTTETQVQSCAITTSGGRVRVDFSAQLVASAEVPTDVTARVTRNGTQVWSGVIGRMNGESRYLVVIGGSTNVDDYVDIPGALNAEGGGFFIDTGVADAPGTYTYALLVTCTAGVEVSERNVALLEIKR